MTAAASFHRRCDGGVDVFVRLTPRSSRDAVDGVGMAADSTVHLKARVRAVPEKGRANTALERLLATVLDIPAGAVSVVAGGTSRLKTVRVRGDAAALEAKLAAIAARDERDG